jgi:hypothetical protein
VYFPGAEVLYKYLILLIFLCAAGGGAASNFRAVPALRLAPH